METETIHKSRLIDQLKNCGTTFVIVAATVATLGAGYIPKQNSETVYPPDQEACLILVKSLVEVPNNEVIRRNALTDIMFRDMDCANVLKI